MKPLNHSLINKLKGRYVLKYDRSRKSFGGLNINLDEN